MLNYISLLSLVLFSISNKYLQARVDRVHVDGLSRTKDDIVRSAVDELFHATDFEDVILKAHKVINIYDCFKVKGMIIHTLLHLLQLH